MVKRLSPKTIIVYGAAPDSIQEQIASKYERNELTGFLESIKNKASYKGWFFGHYHKDIAIDDKHIAIFNNKILI